jgi:hypothetical protein
MKVADVFSTSGHTASEKLGHMILPQREQGGHGVEVVGMMFCDDKTSLLCQGDAMGERLAKVAKEQGMLLMMCDSCALERGLATGATWTEKSTANGTVEGARVGCFPDLYTALASNPPDHVMTRSLTSLGAYLSRACFLKSPRSEGYPDSGPLTVVSLSLAILPRQWTPL